MLEILQAHPVAGAIGTILLVFFFRLLAKAYQIRRRNHNKPGPPHSWIFGHLKIMGATAMSYPKRAHPHVFNAAVRKKYNLGSFFFLDVWPAAQPIIVISDPQVSQQISVERVAPKHPSMWMFLQHLAGPEDMVSSDGWAWQQWRRIFNPGFSTQHLMTLVPGIIDDVQVYVDKLTNYAEKDQVFRLEEDTTRLTIDVIAKVTLDMKFNTQKSDNPCIDALRRQLYLVPNNLYLNPLAMYHPVGIYQRWRNSKIMREYIGKVLDERFAATDHNAPTKQKKRTVIDLALDSYTSGVEADVEKLPSDAPLPAMDKKFRAGAITQIRTFLFAGHDTTSSTVCYIFYLLSKHPKSLERIRQEHEDVLGPVDSSATRIRTDPHLLNKLDYTLCVIKETLRLFPPASGPRIGEPGLKIRDPQSGEEYDTDGYMLWLAHYGLHRNEHVWGESANSFDPDRFSPPHSSTIPDGAWRPFEWGPRNCLGQNLALLEIRIILALTLRRFDFVVALDRLQELRGDGTRWSADTKEPEAPRDAKQDVEGEEMYQVLIGTAKPREGMPVSVRRVVDWKGRERTE